MRDSGVRIRKEAKSFRDFVAAKENRKTIIMIVAVALILVAAKTVKDMVSGTRYIVSDSGTVAGVLRDDADKTISVPLKLETEGHGEKHSMDLTITITSDKDTEENRAKSEEKNEETLFEAELSELIDRISKSKGKKIMLPLSMSDGTKLIWKKGQNSIELLLIFMAPLFIWLLYISGEKKKRDLVKAHVESVRRSLPAFNDHLLLLLGSGLIFRDAFRRIAEGYKKEPEPSYFKKQMVDVLNETDSGVSDIVNVISRKSDEIGVSEFSRLAGIIRDNQLQGVDISSKLKNESEILWDLRKKGAEERGRMAETKLTMPLAVLLMVLVLVTAAPAIIQVEGG